MTERRAGIIQMDVATLAAILRMPEGHEVRAVTVTPSNPFLIEIVVTGPDLPLVNGIEPLPRVSYAIEADKNGRFFF